ncbi:hypothetical protein SAMN05428985_103540 [Nocardioides sp. YR527]|uniref:hypothetical protein n=1 Tax=Nocardioides sp. YR527 TaxID=1881028 RepID=UPI000883B32E|nr:hypothetical protein [Nocardioides sp. YR527]SDK31510.1 hypothetical protein SAMN05428985_103540 [Nocardioides sp. YR527]
MTSAFDFYNGPADNPDPSRYRSCTLAGANVYLVAEVGAPHNYGISRELTVRTVAFGTIPVEATLRLEQVRDDDGLPRPINIETLTCNPDGGTEVPDNEINTELYTRITSLVVDGVAMRLSDTCRTTVPGKMQLHGNGYWYGTVDGENVPPPPLPYWKNHLFNLSTGGELNGTIDVPAFSGCVTADGDDLSALLTATVSGNDNPLRTNQGSAFSCTRKNPVAGGKNLPPGPGQATVESVPCNLGLDPANPLIPPVPEIPEGDR